MHSENSGSAAALLPDSKPSSVTWLAELIAGIAGAGYVAQSWVYIHNQDSILDEGAYLYKGLAHVTGQFSLYQDYGAWTNHMPLSFLIPGYIQKIFGAGLETPRYFALLTGVLMLLGVWVCARRLGGRWWAAIAVLAIAWNPAAIKMYSVAVTQGLIACLFVWVLVLVVGEGRSILQIILGAALAGIMMMTRINMTPLLPLLVLYVAWQHGRRAGIIAAISAGLVIIIGHALFWPGILRMWAYWLPQTVTPFLNPWRPPQGDIFWTANLALVGRLTSFFHSLRFQFVPLAGAFFSWMLWPRRDRWKTESDFRTAVFLSCSFGILLLAHIWATLAQDYCVYCLPGYVAFFSSAGLLLIVVSFPIWRTRISWWAQIILVLVVLLLAAGIGFGAFEDVGDPVMSLPVSRLFLGEPSRITESVALGDVLINKFGAERGVLKRSLSMAFGLCVGTFLLLVALGIWFVYRRRRGSAAPAFANWVLVVFLVTGFIFSPTLALGGGYRAYDCDQNVLQAYRTSGAHLAGLIPPGSSVYWRGRLSAIPLAYVPGISVFPAQLNGDYTIRIGGDPDQLARYGFWNDELAREWAEQADFILIARHYYDGWLQEWVNAGSYDELEPTPLSAHCTEDAQIRIFRRKP